MSEQDNQIQQHIQMVREALDKAEVGPWAVITFNSGQMEVWQSIDNGCICRISGNNEVATSNTQLIANSPTWLQQSIEIIEQQQREIERLSDAHYNIRERAELALDGDREDLYGLQIGLTMVRQMAHDALIISHKEESRDVIQR